MHSDGNAGLFDEYKLGVGLLYEKLRKDFPEIRSVFTLPREVFATVPVSSLVFDRFLPRKPPEDQALEYPLKQYGPGVASYNVNNKEYSWAGVRPAIELFYEELKTTHKSFEERVNAISLRTTDFFETANADTFTHDRLHIEIKSPVSRLPELRNAKALPVFRTTWTLENGTELQVATTPGAVGEREGVVLEIAVQSGQALLKEKGFTELLTYQHQLAGNSFFVLLSDGLRKELGYAEK